MNHIRLAVCGLSPLARDIIRRLVEDVEFVEFVEPLEPSDDLGEDFMRSSADVMICARPEQEMRRLWSAAVAQRPPLAVLNLSEDHAHGCLRALYPYGDVVEELAETSLLDTLRRHMRRLRDPPP